MAGEKECMASLDFEFEKAAFRGFYEQNAELLESAKDSYSALVNALVVNPGTIAVSKIEGRVKDKEECIRKFARKYQPGLEERNVPYEIRAYITDLIGLRTVCLYEDEIDRVAEILRSHFEVIEVTDKVSAMEETEGSFGYKGLHMDLRLNAARSALPDQFNSVMKDNLPLVKRYKLAFEAKDSTNKLNPFTVIRHCLYLSDKGTFSKALTKLARESFEAWLKTNEPAN